MLVIFEDVEVEEQADVFEAREDSSGTRMKTGNVGLGRQKRATKRP